MLLPDLTNVAESVIFRLSQRAPLPNAGRTQVRPTLVRRDTNAAEVGFTARIPRAEKLTLEAKLPMKGGKTYFIQTAVEHFCDLMEQSPSLMGAAKEAIQTSLYMDDTPQDLESISTRIPTALYERFNKLFPEFGATTWFYRRVVGAFARDEGMTIDDEIRNAVAVAVSNL